MNPLQKTSLGSTGLEVTRLGLGCTSLGGMYEDISEEQAFELVHRSLSLGLNLFDTAPFYGSGKSEERLGKALAEIPRDQFVLATKVGRTLIPTLGDDRGKKIFVNPLPFRPVFDFSYDGVMRSFEESLTRLKSDRIDIVHIHDPDDHYQEAIESAYPALEKLRSQGVIRAISVGMKQWQMLVRFAHEGDFDCFLLAGRYTLLDQSAMSKLFPLCIKKNISVILGGTYNSGILATGVQSGAKYDYAEAPPEIVDRVRRIEAVCDHYQVSLKAAASQFALAHSAVTTIIPGAASVKQMNENFNLLQQNIPDDFWTELQAKKLINQDAPLPKVTE
ncbi:putative oxidoreductase, aryl-alcohol dehydrogenase like protein (plasmid) [Cylindrospermum stagnale PCC 7417]|uniref:Putative oxidoreductase, aryl-alcohol dehydrogenase like protein n=1 Tax=Cylindrospermum stagnale PCC 7417 TaxID=56107 RepID=K9X6B8_9NOST|nr:aldo/keto reductase [Cylindrospermum stagnale]AFZ28205.1 putative oxidoreductase, aryl-alcohol dehydrogenase like protein [Cylindrospermum stagnale PCC 7417]